MDLWFNYSTILNEDLSPNDPQFWSRPTSISCDIVRTTGLILCIVGSFGIILNGGLICGFIRYKIFRSSSNIYMMFIAIMGFLASCTILPLTGTSAIYCQWLYKRIGCQLESIMAFWYGCSSCYLLCVVSLSRCYIIVYPFDANKVTVGKSVVVSCFAVFLAFIWAILPILGWNEYTLEGARISCCINLFDRRFSYVSFTFSLFIFVYMVPLLTIIISNTVTLLSLQYMREKIKQGIRTVLNRKRIEMERRIVISIIITTCGFIVTWTPYAITFFVSALRGKDSAISPTITFYCAFFAKSSIIWIPLFYIATSKQFQRSFANINSTKSQNNSAQMQNNPSRSLDAPGHDNGSVLLRVGNDIPLENKLSSTSDKAADV